MKLNGQRWGALLVLVAILAALGFAMVPAHFGSLWGDRDFTDWSVPIANRLHDGARLYEEGLHTPMPPLPYIVPRLLFPHGGLWLDGSLLNYSFQAGMILLLFWAFAAEIGVGLAFITALAAIPVYLAMPKTMLYDSMTQFLAAAVGIATAAFLKNVAGHGTNQTGQRWQRLGFLGLLLGLLLLTKQNTGIGALAGVGAALFLLPPSLPVRQRFVNISFVGVCTVIFFCLIALAFNRYLSFTGLIHDVFLTGSEPKGGSFRILKSLVIYSIQIGVVSGGLYLLIYIYNACVGTGAPSWRSLSSQWWLRSSPIAASLPTGVKTLPLHRRKAWLYVAALISFALGLGLSIIYAKTGVSLKGTMMDTAWPLLTLNVGLCLVLLVIAALLAQLWLTPKSAHGPRSFSGSPFASYAIIFLACALFHNLSVARWRWTVDNNPLIFLALALLFTAGIAIPPAQVAGARRPAWLAPIIAAFMIFIMWPLAHFVALNVITATETWPEIHHLTGARFRPESSGMRQLVATVRSYSTTNDTVLLLPNDPNVEAWFERDRPKFSSAIIFTDQYWERYVDRDFASLLAHPPKVIIIGPRDYWRYFCRGWHINGAAEKFIDRVRGQMIARDYDLKSEQAIAYQGGTDIMDVYVRRTN